MPDLMFDHARELFLTKQIDWLTDDIKVVLIDTSLYTVDVTHQFLGDIPTNARVALSPNLASKTAAGGAANAATLVIPAVTGAQIAAFALYADSGSPLSSPLIVYLTSYTGLPVTPNGGDITIIWPTDANKIFRL